MPLPDLTLCTSAMRRVDKRPLWRLIDEAITRVISSDEHSVRVGDDEEMSG
jgi:hypothetical protein